MRIVHSVVLIIVAQLVGDAIAMTKQDMKALGERIGTILAKKYPNGRWLDIDENYLKDYQYSPYTLISIDEYARLKYLEIIKGAQIV